MNQEARPFDFTPDDLEANRRGIISEHQRQQLISMGRGLNKFTGKSIIWLFLFLILASGLILTVWFFSAGSPSVLLSEFFSDPFGMTIQVGSICLIAPLVTALVYFLYRRNASIALHSVNAPLLSDEGIAEIVNGYSRTGTQFKIVRIGRREYINLRPYASLFKSGQSYRIYYVKAGALREMVLSIEELEK